MDSGTASLLKDAAELHRRGALADAADRYTSILDRDPGNADALYSLAQISCQQGRLPEGIDLARKALAIDPQRARTHLLLGMALARLGRPHEALASIDQAIASRPELADAHGNRGDLLAELGRHAEAVENYDRALALAPDSIENWCNRGAALQDLRRYGEALASYDRALALKPDFAEVHFNRGTTLNHLARYEDALIAYDRALVLRPDTVDALHNRATVLVKLKRYDEAAADFERVLALDPDNRRAVGELANCYLLACDWNKIAAIAARLKSQIADDKSIISPFTLIGFPVSNAELLACTRRYVADKVPRVPALPRKQPPARAEKIRLAYLSADFRNHATAYLAARLFEGHDRDRFEVIGISYGPDDGSEMRARLARSFDRFHDVSARSDRDAGAFLHELGVDIAVDLKGHTEYARPAILGYRPAPIQVSYLAYPGTTGADFIDYVIADEIVLPFDQQPYYTERIVHLPECYQVNDSHRPRGARAFTRRELGLPDKAFVFCCFNNSWKITAEMFDIWMRLLGAVEGSVLWLFRSNEAAMANLRREATARSIDPARLIFAEFAELPDHLARLECADLFVDTLPCNAHTTASDALRAGVPLVTCLGTTFAGRVAASLLQAVGLPELVTRSLGEYEALAQTLAADPPLLSSIRRKLVENRRTCPLFDSDRFRRHIEAAYVTMWEIWQRGETIRGFRVDPLERQTRAS